MIDQFGMPMVDCRPSHEVITELRQQVTLLRDGQYDIARSSAAIAIERCKNATGMRRKIDMYVSANQCAEDVTEALAETEPKP